MIEFADIIVDLQAGDTGKGKVAHSLAERKQINIHTLLDITVVEMLVIQFTTTV